jgi:hypothetical protein
MLRMRVFRLGVPFTILGLEVWALGSIGIGSIIALQFLQGFPPYIAIPGTVGIGWLVMLVIGFARRFFPGRAISHTYTWLTQSDRYVIRRDSSSYPLVVLEPVSEVNS